VKIKSLWPAAGVGLCISLGLPANAQSQTAPMPAEDTPTTLEEITVVGTNLSRSRAIADKQTDARVIDALGTDELGQLPDKNVGEALNRLPGVTMLVEKGEGRYVQIRGINASLNNVTINGVSIGTPEAELGGRAAPLDIVSTSVLSAVQVIKTPTPDMDGQGIGGTVNIETALPFDRPDDFYGFASGRYGYEDIRPSAQAFGGHDPYQFDGMISGKNHSKDFGYLLSISHSAREYIAPGIYQDDWTTDPGQAVPQNVKNNYYVIGRERTNINGALQWELDNGDNYFLRAFYAGWDEFQHRNRYEQNLTEDVVPSSASEGISGPNRVAANIRLEDAEKSLLSVGAGGENNLGRTQLSYSFDYHHNEQASPNDYWEFRSGEIFGPNQYHIAGDGVATITPDEGTPDRQDPSLFDFRRVRFSTQDINEDGLSGRIDLRWDQSDETFFKVGMKLARTKRDNDQSQERYDPGAQDLTLGTSADFTNGAFFNDTPNGRVPNIYMDIAAMNRFFDDPANAAFFEYNEGSSFTSRFASDYSLAESIYAAYGMVSTRLDALELIGGARVEYTDVDSHGYLNDGNTAQRIDAGGSYVDVLPSLIANLHLDEDVILRGAVTRALGRPNYETIAPRTTFGEDGTVGNVTVGNPDVEARRSWNFDLSAEWYPSPLSMLAVAVFHKNIGDEIVTGTTSYSDQTDMQAALAQYGLQAAVPTDGLTRLDISTPTNDASATLNGVEFTGQTQFAWLPTPFDGFGVFFSAAFIDGETKLADGSKLPLIGQAKTSYAATLFYQAKRLDASLSYAYNGSYLTDPNDDPALRLDQGKYGRWDAKIAYRVTDKVKVFVEGVNLNNEPTTEFQGGNKSWNTEYEYVGRTVYLGIAGSF
jgi:TonB-dependent receptor